MSIRCSFCGKSKETVRRMVSGPSVFICNECVQHSADIIERADEEARPGISDESQRLIENATDGWTDFVEADHALRARIAELEATEDAMKLLDEYFEGAEWRNGGTEGRFIRLHWFIGDGDPTTSHWFTDGKTFSEAAIGAVRLLAERDSDPGTARSELRDDEDRRPFGHNEVAAVCREELQRTGADPAKYDHAIYRFAAGWSGGRNPTAVRLWLKEHPLEAGPTRA